MCCGRSDKTTSKITLSVFRGQALPLISLWCNLVIFHFQTDNFQTHAFEAFSKKHSLFSEKVIVNTSWSPNYFLWKSSGLLNFWWWLNGCYPETAALDWLHLFPVNFYLMAPSPSASVQTFSLLSTMKVLVNTSPFVYKMYGNASK